jgi:hypothetical protein
MSSGAGNGSFISFNNLEIIFLHESLEIGSKGLFS